MSVQHMKAPEKAQEDTSPRKINVTSKSPVGDISVVTLIRTDTTLDHSQKAEKVYLPAGTCKICLKTGHTIKKRFQHVASPYECHTRRQSSCSSVTTNSCTCWGYIRTCFGPTAGGFAARMLEQSACGPNRSKFPAEKAGV